VFIGEATIPMKIMMSATAAAHVEKKGGVMAVDFIKPLG